MPHVVDPPAGYVANWNTKPALGWYDGDLSGSNSRPGGAAQRVLAIRRQLAHARNLTSADLMRIDTRTGETDMRASSYLPAMLRLRGRSGLSASQRHALRMLAHWDGRAYAPGERGGSSPLTTDPTVTTDGPAATLFAAWRAALEHRLFHTLPSDVRARLNTASVTHQYDVTPLDNLTLRVLRPSWAGLGSPRAVVGDRTPLTLLRRTLATTIRKLNKRYGDSVKKWRRRHGVSTIESLTGVIGPSETEPFEDRGSWVQEVAFTTGRPR
jgi:acyl-homoserine lactone acylase PvdQ